MLLSLDPQTSPLSQSQRSAVEPVRHAAFVWPGAVAIRQRLRSFRVARPVRGSSSFPCISKRAARPLSMAARQWPAGSFATARLTAATPADPVGPKCRFDRHPRRPAAGCVVADRGFVDAAEPASPRYGKATAPSSMRPAENLRFGLRPERLPEKVHRPPPDPATESAERHATTGCVVRVRTTSPQRMCVRPRLNEAALCPVRLTSK